MRGYMIDTIESDMLNITDKVDSQLRKVIFKKIPKQIKDKNQETHMRYYYAYMVLIIYSLEKLQFWSKMSTRPRSALSMIKKDIKRKLNYLKNA